MYRIEVKPGEENVFRTIEELSTAIRNGLVTPRSRIFHNASQKWLPIEFHPHYKKALQLPKTNSGEQPAVTVSSPTPKAQQSPKIPGPPRPQDSAKSPEPIKAIEPPPAPQVPKAPQPVTKTRELEIVYIPPVEAKASGTKPAPVPPPPPAPAPAPVVAKAPAPKTAPTPPSSFAPAESRSTVAVLPEIDYPERTPVESLIPVASASKARVTNRRRSLMLGTGVAVLIAGAYVGLSGAMPSHEAAADSRPAPAVTDTPAEPVHQLAVAPPARADSATSPLVTAAAPGRSPSFGPPATPAASAPKRQIVTSIGATTPSKDSVEAIEPAPVDVDISVPSVPAGDSLAPTTSADSGLGRILRAVGGKAGSTARP